MMQGYGRDTAIFHTHLPTFTEAFGDDVGLKAEARNLGDVVCLESARCKPGNT